MKAFRFSLDPVLRLRRQVETQRKMELAAAAQAVVRQQGRLAGWFGEQEATREVLGALKRPGEAPLDLEQIRLHEGYLNTLVRRIRQGVTDLARLRAGEEERRRALLAASRDCRVLERLRERRRAEWTYAAGVEEQKFLDEVAQQETVRRLVASRKETANS
jgi:flagellar FliJ protein